MNYILNEVIIIVVIAIGVIGVGALIGLAAGLSVENECKSLGREYDTEYRLNDDNTCDIKLKNKWLPKEYIEREGL